MRRAGWYVVTGAVTGFLGLLGLHAVTTQQPLPVAAGAGKGGATPAVSGGQTSPAGAGSSGPQFGTGAGSGAPAHGKVQHATGALENFGYGQLAVTVTVKGKVITDVAVPHIQFNDPPSQQIANYAIPQLKSEVLAANSAQIQAISGATYTSTAYAQSLQSALDKLHAL